MEIMVAVVITYFIVSMKKILTRPYTLTSRVGGFSYAGRELASTDVNSHGYSDGYSGPCLHRNSKTFFPVAVEAEHSGVEFCKRPARRG